MTPRSLLFAPGDKPVLLRKTLAAGADAVIWDLEDAVALPAKEVAREAVREAVRAAPTSITPILVRINALAAGMLHEDLAAVDSPAVRGVVLAKAEHPDELRRVEEALAARERDARLPAGSLQLYAQIESCLGVVHAVGIATACPRVAGLCFGGEDFTLDLGVPRTRAGAELDYARSAVAIAAASARIAAFDTVFTDLVDDAGLEADCARARALGLKGKLAIHPKQLATINRLFSPSDDELAWATRIVAAFDAARVTGRGVTVLDGRMIDAPVVARARQILGARRD